MKGINSPIRIRQISRNGNRKGRGVSSFTLLELLVVVSIIALLAGLLLPSLNRARQKSMGISCQSNLRQLGIAFAGYSASNNDYMPPALINRNGLDNFSGMHDPVNGAITWMASLYPHIGIKNIHYGMPPKRTRKSVYVCPSILRPDSYYQDYGYNAYLFCCALQTNGSVMNWGGNQQLQRISGVKFVSNSIMLCDSWGDTNTRRDQGYFLLSEDKICYRHAKKANVAWADGHVTAEDWHILNNPNGLSGLPWNKNNSATVWISVASRGVYTYGYAPYN